MLPSRSDKSYPLPHPPGVEQFRPKAARYASAAPVSRIGLLPCAWLLMARLTRTPSTVSSGASRFVICHPTHAAMGATRFCKNIFTCGILQLENYQISTVVCYRFFFFNIITSECDFSHFDGKKSFKVLVSSAGSLWARFRC